MRNRAARLAHGHKTNSQDTWPAIGTPIAYTANRAGVADRLPDPAGPQSIAVALALLAS
jgi:hypothetical protein